MLIFDVRNQTLDHCNQAKAKSHIQDYKMLPTNLLMTIKKCLILK